MADEQRLQEYLQLIQKLIECPSGQEPEILEANQHLLDVGLIQAMEQAADVFSREGSEQIASYLQQMAGELKQVLGNSDQTAACNDYNQFLGTLFQRIRSGDLQQVRDLLTANQHLLDLQFAQAMTALADNLIEEYPEEKDYIIAYVGNLSIQIQEFPLGNAANNQEIAIAGYQWILQHDVAGTSRWATTQNNLGLAYQDRIQGDKAQNLEHAIAYYQQALQVYTRDAFPQDWAMTQNNLGNAYLYRIQGDKAQNLEDAIAYYQQA
uniref:tetratricopeptide repeat protein n=1 Tax=Geitlerinema sp. PCC 9228 TaxID=111611 RepID=UPI0011149FB1